MLVSGGAGFLGSHLVEALVKRGDEVTVLDDFSAGRLSNLYAVKDQVEIVRGSVCDLQLVHKLVIKQDAVYHLATQCLMKGLEDPVLMNDVNTLGTFNVCASARERKTHLIYISSSETYGVQGKFPIKEDAPMNPVSIYGFTKLLGEQYVLYYNYVYRLPAVVIRPFNLFGPRHRDDAYAAVITAFLKRARAMQSMVIHGDGLQTRDYSWVGDGVEGILLLSKLTGGEIVNLGSGREISILELAEKIYQAYTGLRGKPPLTFTEPRVNDLRRLQADTTLARSHGWKPKVSFEDGLRRYVKWWRRGEEEEE